MQMGKSPCHWAVQRKNHILLGYLILEGSDPNLADFTGKTPLTYAVVAEDEPTIKVIPP